MRTMILFTIIAMCIMLAACATKLKSSEVDNLRIIGWGIPNAKESYFLVEKIFYVKENENRFIVKKMEHHYFPHANPAYAEKSFVELRDMIKTGFVKPLAVEKNQKLADSFSRHTSNGTEVFFPTGTPYDVFYYW